MMKENHKELITEIREVLSAYELPYEEGAWEAFNKRPEKKRLLLWPWMSAAATLLLVASIWLISDRSEKKVQQQASVKASAATPQTDTTAVAALPSLPMSQQNMQTPGIRPDSNPVTAVVQHAGPVAVDSVMMAPFRIHPIVLSGAPAASPLALQLSPVYIAPKAPMLDLTSGAYVMLQEKTVPQPARLPALRPLTRDTSIKAPVAKADNFMEFLLREKEAQVASVKPAELPKAAKAASKASGSKWDFGVEVLPTVTSSAVNVGAGVLTAYKLSDHFSVGTGVAYTGLGSAVAHQPGISALEAKQLQAVNASYRAIDIPLNLVYNLNKKVYTSVGVSYINVVEERSTNTFVSEQRATYSSVSPSGSTQNTVGFETQKSQEAAQTQTLKGMGSLGFFNFSIGRKQQVFNKYHISIEPFIKVPVGKLSQQDLNLTNGGMKFKIEF